MAELIYIHNLCEASMNKHNLMKKIASVATELDYNGFEKEAKKVDSLLIKLAAELTSPEFPDDPDDRDYPEWVYSYILKPDDEDYNEKYDKNSPAFDPETLLIDYDRRKINGAEFNERPDIGWDEYYYPEPDYPDRYDEDY